VSAPDAPQPDTLHLEHKVFAMFGPPLFRRADTDQATVMLVRMGERDIAMPLRSLAREFGLREDTPDGRMLALISESLEYVSALRIGDKLPAEVLTGAASWEPSPHDVRLANARLQVELLDWLCHEGGGDPVQVTPENLAAGEVASATRDAVQTALNRAAEALGLASPEEVLGRIEELGEELAYIEALRNGLLRHIVALGVKLETLAQRQQASGTRSDTLARVRQLASVATRQIRQRFEEQDAHVGEVMSALRHVESHRAFIRANRDWLYRSQRGWDPILAEWDVIDLASDGPLRLLLDRTYHFLAPRFMPVTEWVSLLAPTRQKKQQQTMVW
jgi:hypothetical protein